MQVGAGEHRHVRARAGLGLSSASEEAGAVYDVQAEELTLAEEEVVVLLKQGRLRSTDLVEVDGAWSSLLDSLPFAEEAAKRTRVEGAKRTSKLLLRALLPAILVVVILGGLIGYTVLFPPSPSPVGQTCKSNDECKGAAHFCLLPPAGRRDIEGSCTRECNLKGPTVDLPACPEGTECRAAEAAGAGGWMTVCMKVPPT